ncbi:TRAP transporter substrate-binding protein [Paracoccus sp. (in: a-proteobacteria)]|uniref:TRAP transporter substrate-binding protein n=1 Tax=Paracoccus sp. TaxID=267 RepID=UPI00322076DB
MFNHPAKIALSLAFALTAQTALAQDVITMRVAHSMPATHSYETWIADFATELERLAPGRVEVESFPNAQLGSETEYLEGIKFGTIEGAVVGRHGQIDQRLEVLNLPMIYRDADHIDEVLRGGGEVQATLDDIMYENGYKVLGWGELGFRDITTKGVPIRKADDLKGVDIRVPNVEPWLVAFREWGANPTPLDFSELYSALQQGVVDAQENPPEVIVNSRFDEVQDTLSLTEHASIPSQFIVSTRFWEGLDEDLQSAMMEAATISRDKQVANTRAANEALVAELESRGMTIVSDVDRESFRAGAEASWAAFEGKIGADLIEAVQSAGSTE